MTKEDNTITEYLIHQFFEDWDVILDPMGSIRFEVSGESFAEINQMVARFHPLLPIPQVV